MMLRPSIFADNFVDSLFDEFLDDSFRAAAPSSPVSMMNTDVRETDKEYQIEMELPGFSRENVKADLKDGYLTIEASRGEEKSNEENGKYLRKERLTGRCRRSFYVGENVTQEDISAKFADGILTISVPKREAKTEVEDKKYIPIGD